MGTIRRILTAFVVLLPLVAAAGDCDSLADKAEKKACLERESAAQKAPAKPAGAAQQCQATTKKGRQCKRMAKPGASYCWQHGG